MTAAAQGEAVPAAAGAEPAPLSAANHAGWALGSFATSVLINSTGLLAMRFMTDELGVGAGLAATLLAVSKVYDGVTDPLMGVISDRTRSRWGRRRPYLFVGAWLCGLAMYASFNVPRFESPALLTAWVLGMLLFFATAYTVFRIPYLSMGADLTRSFQGRSRLMTWAVYGSSVGSLFATSAAPFLLAWGGGGRAAHELVGTVLGVLILLTGLGCFYLTAGAPDGGEVPRQSYGWRERMVALAQNRPFVLLIAAKVLLFIGLSVHITGIAYFTRHVLGASDYSLGGLFLLQTLGMMVSQPLWARIAARLGRRGGLQLALLCDVLIFCAYWFAEAGSANAWLAVLGPLKGITSGGIFQNIQAMLADTMNYDRVRHGLRREGLFAGIYVMVEKFTAALGTALFGAVIGAMGYVATQGAAQPQSAEALLAIRACVSLLPAAIMLLAIAILAGYRLTQDAVEGGTQPAVSAGSRDGTP